jgi:hypothetical protein
MDPLALLARYRASGADPPFGDPRRHHGVGMEGYYWRLTDAGAGRVVIVLCGVCAARDGTWAVVALAAHPYGLVRHAVVPVAVADSRRLSVRAGDVVAGDEGELRVDLGSGARLHVALDSRFDWPRRALGGLGVAQVVPGLGQYWHPHVLGARVRGTLELEHGAVSLDGATAYAEKNWGSRFAPRWWWGQAQGFDDPGVCAAFAGGRIDFAGVDVAPTAVMVSIGEELMSLSPPLARTVASVGADAWRVRARRGRLEVEIEGEGGPAALLPVPVPLERRVETRSRQVLAGRMALRVRRGRRTVFRGESALAGLEREIPGVTP